MTRRQQVVVSTGRGPGNEQGITIYRQAQIGQALPEDTVLLHVQRARGDCLCLLGRCNGSRVLGSRIGAQMECVQVGAALVRRHNCALAVLVLVLVVVRRSLVTGQGVGLLVVNRYVPGLVQLHRSTVAAADGPWRVPYAQQIVSGRTVDVAIRLWHSLNALLERVVNATRLRYGFVPVLRGEREDGKEKRRGCLY